MAQNRFYSSGAAATTLTAGVTNTATTITVGAITGFPVSYPYTLILDKDTASEEIVTVTGGSGTTLTVSRGQDGTAGVSHNFGAGVIHGVSARDFTEPSQHIGNSAGVHGVSGSIVGTTDTQALTNKDLSAGTNVFPASLATLAGAQVLTNKDLTGASNTFPATLGTTNTVQTVTAAKTWTGGSGTTPSVAVAPTTDTIPVKILRGTDTTPAQKLLVLRDHADLNELMSVDATGAVSAPNVTATSGLTALTANVRNITAGANTPTDSVALVARRGTDASPVSDIVQVTNAANTSTFWKIDANGNVQNKIPAVSAKITANIASIGSTDVSVVTAPTITADGLTKVVISFSWLGMLSTAASDIFDIKVMNGATVLHTVRCGPVPASSATGCGGSLFVEDTPVAGSVTYVIKVVRSVGSGTGTLVAASNGPATVRVAQVV